MTLRVVVIGAGIVGAAAALRLTESGGVVTLVDAGTPGAGTSATSFAWLNANRKLPREYHELSAAAMDDWRTLADESEDRSWYSPNGHLTWAADDGEAELHDRVERLRAWGYPAELLTPERAADLEPELRIPQDATIAFFSSEGFIEPRPAVAAVVARAVAAGAALITGDAVVSIEAAHEGVNAVMLSSGLVVPTDIAVCCAGWRTVGLLGSHGVQVPLIDPGTPGSRAACLVARVPTTSTGVLRRVVHAPNLNARPTAEGGLHLEASDLNAAVDLTTSDNELHLRGRELLRRAGAILPALESTSAQTPEVHLCVRPLPTDGYPIVGWAPEVKGLYLIVTHSGVTLASYLARLAADEITSGRLREELSPYRATRFEAQP